MTAASPGPVYRIATERLVLRCWEPVDAPLMKAALDASRKHLQPWMPWATGEPADLENLIQMLRRWRGSFDLDKDYIYGIFSPDGLTALGSTGLHTTHGMDVREIGYWIHVDHINRGYATETAAALTRVAFEVDRVQRVEIHCDPENYASAAIPRKLGFTHEATRRQDIVDGQGRRRDTMIWTMLREEYPGSVPARQHMKAFDAAGRKVF